jgi:hypothetical protein
MYQLAFGLSEQAHQIRTLSKSYGESPTPVVQLLKTRTKHAKRCQDLPAIHVNKSRISPTLTHNDSWNPPVVLAAH